MVLQSALLLHTYSLLAPSGANCLAAVDGHSLRIVARPLLLASCTPLVGPLLSHRLLARVQVHILHLLRRVSFFFLLFSWNPRWFTLPRGADPASRELGDSAGRREGGWMDGPTWAFHSLELHGRVNMINLQQAFGPSKLYSDPSPLVFGSLVLQCVELVERFSWYPRFVSQGG